MPRLSAPRRRRAISLTSLIDVIFLLLLFFMLSSTFTRVGDLPFLAATSGGAVAAGPPPAFLRVLPDRVVLDLAEVALADLPAALAAVAGGLVLVAPAEGVTAQRLVDVLVAGQGVPGLRLRLVGG
jgi:biopolymer transport protein ExbD